MWETWSVSQKLRCKPSEYLNISDPVLAYYLDRAVWLFGSTVEAELNDVEAKAKNPKSVPSRKQMVLHKWIPAPGGDTRGRFRDPALGKR